MRHRGLARAVSLHPLETNGRANDSISTPYSPAVHDVTFEGVFYNLNMSFVSLDEHVLLRGLSASTFNS